MMNLNEIIYLILIIEIVIISSFFIKDKQGFFVMFFLLKLFTFLLCGLNKISFSILVSVNIIILLYIFNHNSMTENFEKIQDIDRFESDNYLKNRLIKYKDDYSKAQTIIEERNELTKEIKQAEDKMKGIDSQIIETKSKKNSLFSF